ncbi:hypothetical protein U0070_012850, partial [Myodes glareolus]
TLSFLCFNMGPVLHSISITVVVAEFILGNLSNGWTMVKNCIDWVNKREISPIDQILIILAISRITLIWEVLFMWVKTRSFSFITEEELKISSIWRKQTVNSMETELAIFSELFLFSTAMFSVTPFSLALISFLLLIFSLWKHCQKMQLNTRGHRDPNTKAHTNAMKIIVPLLLLYATYILSLLTSWIAEKYQSELVQIICMITGLMYPLAHSLILILGKLNFGNLSNGFIVLSNFLDCITKQKLSLMDKILLTRITLIWEMIFGSTLYVIQHYLCFLATSISGLPQPLASFIYLKWKFKQLIVGVLLGSLAFLLANLIKTSTTLEEKIHQYGRNCYIHCCHASVADFEIVSKAIWKVNEMVFMPLMSLVLLILNIMIFNIHVDIWIDRSKRNTSNIKNHQQIFKLFLFPNLMFILIHFTVTLFVFFLLIFSLQRHLKTMQLSVQEFRHVSTIAHVKALQM